MKQTEYIMGMPITIEIIGSDDVKLVIADAFELFRNIDERFSTYKSDSEISRINRGLPRRQWSKEVKTVLDLCEQTKQETRGYFDVSHNGKLDPSGLVKGWAIQRATELLREHGARNFYVDAGGDIQSYGANAAGLPWKIGIRNPFNMDEVIKTVTVSTEGVATSGTYIRGQHIYNPHASGRDEQTVKSLTVIGPNIYDADRFATAAFAMGEAGITFIESLPGFEGYMIDRRKVATFTTGFERFVANA
jgi:thiamine biosynthesis lipoprotein